MAGTTTLTSDSPLYDIDRRIIGKRVIVTATADASDGSFPNLTLKKLNGYLQPVITNPGSTAPTDNYDISLAPSTDSTAEITGSALANRDTSSTEVGAVTISGSATPAYLNGDYILSIANNSVNSASVVITMDVLAVTKG
jgi:hypothetical protein